jgi:uncharacterized membrane protein YccC
LKALWPPGPTGRLAIRTTVAAMVSYGLAIGLGLPQAFWAVVTAVIVIQVSVGGTLTAGLDRIAGTTGGAAVGAFMATVKPMLGLPDAWALLLAVAPLSILAAAQLRFRIAPVTAVIVLLTTPAGLTPQMAALLRCGDILLGSLIGLLVSLLVLPARAHELLLGRGADILRLLAELLEGQLAALSSPAETATLDALGLRYHTLRGAAAIAGLEAQRERTSRLSDGPAPEPLLRGIGRVRNDIAMLSRTTPEPLPPELAAHLQPELASLNASLSALLGAAAAHLAGQGPAPDPSQADTALADFLNTWRTRRDALDAAWAGRPQLEAVHALPFALETLRRDLGELLTIIELMRAAGRRA